MTVTTSPDEIKKLRRQLFAGEYRFVPLLTGKKITFTQEWTTIARQQTAADAEVFDPGHANTGILADGLRAVDLDLDDPVLAAKVRDLAIKILGPGPMRTRANSPRTLMVYRAAEGDPPKRILKGTRNAKIEVLGRGQQFAAFGTHDSGVAYEWLGDSPLTVRRDSLPVVTEVKITEFLNHCAPIIGVPEVAQPRSLPATASQPGQSKEGHPIGRGQREPTLFALACKMRRQGVQRAGRIAALRGLNSTFDEPHADITILRIDAKSARYYPAAGDVPRSPGATSASETPSQNIDSDPVMDGWGVPEPLGSELPPVPTFDPALLPVALHPWCIDIAERMQVPLDLPAVAAVAALGASVMRRAMIQPKALDNTWTEYPNLWGAIIADPGLMKSPVINAVMAPMRQVESLWRTEYQSELADARNDKVLAALKTRAWEQQFISAHKNGGEPPIKPDDSVPEPRQRRILTADSTFEKLHEIMADNPAGIACWRDELAGWLACLERPGRESERQFYLEGWSGHWGGTIDRIGRGSIHVEHVCLSVFGGIQPNRLRSYIADVLSGGPTDDGLIQRFGLIVWPDFGGQWRFVDALPNTDAQQRAADVYTQLVKLDAENPLRLKFAPDAQELFVAWLSALEAKIRSVDTPSVLRGHFAKFRKLMPALSLLFALADGHTDAVPLESAKRAAGWCEYLEPHACRVYASKLTPEMAAAQTLGRKLSNGWKRAEGYSTLRDAYRSQWAGLTSPDEARAALHVLCEYRWVRKEQVASDGAGRPSEIYRINPRITEVK